MSEHPEHHDYPENPDYPIDPSGNVSQSLVAVPQTETVEAEPTPSYTGPTFQDFGGLDNEIDRLRNTGVILQNPELAEEWDVEIPTGILLCGPAGVGKTELVRAFAYEIEATLTEIAVSDILDKWVGQSNARLRSAFSEAAATPGTVVLFFDEFDGLFGKGDPSGSEGVSKGLLSEMKGLMSSLREKQPNTIVVAATNSITGFEDALLRPGRFDAIIQVPKPDEDARSSIFAKLISRNLELYDQGILGDDEIRPEDFDDSPDPPRHSGGIDIVSLAVATEGFTGADIKTILKAARTKRLVSHIQHGEPLGWVTQDDIMGALNAFRRQRLSSND